MYFNCFFNKKSQADRDLYKKEMQEMLLAYPNLRVVEASVEDIILNEEEKVKGIVTQDGKKNLLFLQYFHICDCFFMFYFMSYALLLVMIHFHVYLIFIEFVPSFHCLF